MDNEKEKIFKNIDEFQTPAMKVLVGCLVLAIIVIFGWLFGIVGGRDGDCKEELKYQKRESARKDIIIDRKDSLIMSIRTARELESRIDKDERERMANSLDSISKIVNKLIK